ncbi:ABC transporter permease [Halococcus saccharolyticus]|uniref:Binding-protein-dependent transporters inner membrane component n=1 Tax=Halococcus saccharolyticus DSM 5350 TaxID=1227455 RepID=M0MH27_9EURY|nr:ABC transporter permease [Halococcus saccharolyticus]EMA45001.1 binding-protein-dependent transporters inner membrane component [Halococcus saccharolyticus DSM 5350]
MATSDTQSDEMLSSGRTEETGADESERAVKSRVGWRYTLSQVRSDPTALAGLCIIGFMTAVAVFAYIDAKLLDYWFASTYWVNPEVDPVTVEALLPPVGVENALGTGTLEHPLGTDNRGRDILARLFYGTRIAIQVGFIATAFGLFGGVIVGAVAGYYGGWVDDVLMRGVETLYAIPFLILVITFMSVFGRDLVFAMIGVGIGSIPVFARLIRSRVLSVREEDYVEAARAAGVRDRNIIFRHVVPNSFAPVLVQATLQVGVSIIIVAGLSFLGFGVQPPTPSWGQMLAQSRNYMLQSVWFSLWPGLAILITVVGFNLFGDGLRDALDPRLNN